MYDDSRPHNEPIALRCNQFDEGMSQTELVKAELVKAELVKEPSLQTLVTSYRLEIK
jgi:hypothetical protein